MNTKRILAVLLSMVMILSMCSCSLPSFITAGSSAQPSAVTPEPVVTPEPTPEPTPTPAPQGSVYYINSDPSADATWQKLAADYTAQTGVTVRVQTVSDNYAEVLSTALDSDNVPTLFAVNKDNFIYWKQSCLDLSGTDFLAGLLSEDLQLTGDNGSVLAAAYDFDCWGILVNTELLGRAGFKVEDIRNYDSFSYIVGQITEHKYELGFAAVALELTEDTWHYTECMLNSALYYEFTEDGITNAPGYLRGSYFEQIRYLWDTLIDNCAASVSRYHLDAVNAAEAQREIGAKEAVFAIISSTEIAQYTDDQGLSRNEVSMVPFFGGFPNEENSGLSCGNMRYWCVNREADDLDIQATLDFLKWVTTESSAAASLVEAYEAIPYVAAPNGNNPCLNAANAYFKKGCFNVSWYTDWIPSRVWESETLRFLKNYTLGQNAGENMWYNVTEAMRNTWRNEYQATHS